MGSKATHHIRGNALHPVRQTILPQVAAAPKLPRASEPEAAPSSENVPAPGRRRKSR